MDQFTRAIWLGFVPDSSVYRREIQLLLFPSISELIKKINLIHAIYAPYQDFQVIGNNELHGYEYALSGVK